MPVTAADHQIATTAHAVYDCESVCVFYRRDGNIHGDRINNIIE